MVKRPDWETEDTDASRTPATEAPRRVFVPPPVLLPDADRAGGFSTTPVGPQQPAGADPGEPRPVATAPPAFYAREEPIPAGDQFQTAILGPVGSGKTYLFQAMVHRLHNNRQQGVMTRYLSSQGVALWEKTVTLPKLQERQASRTTDAIDYSKGHRSKLTEFNRQYRSWQRLEPTRKDEFRRFTMVLKYRTGWLGHRVESMRLSFIDCAGELHEQRRSASLLADEAWDAYRHARVVVFCLPIWAAFPGDLSVFDRLAPSERAEARSRFYRSREETLEKFSLIVENFTQLRQEQSGRDGQKVRVVLAVTQADSVHSGLQTLADRWVRRYIADPRNHLRRLSKVGGPTTYLAAARDVSNYMAGEFTRSEDHRVYSIPGQLEMDGARPWIIPVSAIDGEVLEKRRDRPPNPPEPAHVELPLLLALCEAHNALM